MKQFIWFCIGVSLTRLLNEAWRSTSSGDLHTFQLQQSGVDHVSEKNSDDKKYEGPRPKKLGDGCRHIFLDVGSNIGVHARMLLEPHLYPKKVGVGQGKFRSRNFFAQQFGLERQRNATNFNSQVCIFAFEPNPSHVQRHREMEAVYAKMGWRYQFIPAGVGDKDGELTFYHIGKGNKELERGFTTAKEKCRKECRPERVEVIRLSDWIENEIHGRVIPNPLTSAVSKKYKLLPPKVVMKMDIEMMEWIVFPDLISSGVLCRDVDALLGEFHTTKYENDFPINFGNWTLNSYAEAEVLKEQLFGIVDRAPNCKTELVEGDDESYGSDGMPWPTPHKDY